MSKSFIDQSKVSWEPSDGRQPSTEELQLGCLQRIASSTELMAQNYVRLQNDLNNHKRWYAEECAKSQQLRNSIASYKGTITKLKKKLNHR